MLLQSLVEIIPPPMYLRYFGIISAWKDSVIPKLEKIEFPSRKNVLWRQVSLKLV